jgi:hypothetical protein
MVCWCAWQDWDKEDADDVDDSGASDDDIGSRPNPNSKVMSMKSGERNLNSLIFLFQLVQLSSRQPLFIDCQLTFC